MKTELRMLNPEGIVQFQRYLEELYEDNKREPPSGLLEDRSYSYRAPGAACVEPREFQSKWEFGSYAKQFLEQGNVRDQKTLYAPALWAWLALYYIDQVCPKLGNGARKVLKSTEKYIPSLAHVSSTPDKHLLFFPWKMVSLHGEDAAWLLSGELHSDAKEVRELANSYRRNVSKPYLALARALYFDPTTNRVKRGATTNRAGSLRRLDRVVSQLDMTFDIFDLDAESFARLLPAKEFKRWLPSPQSKSDR